MLLTYMCHDIIYIACHITINKSYSNLLQRLCCLAIAVIKNKQTKTCRCVLFTNFNKVGIAGNFSNRLIASFLILIVINRRKA